MTENELLEAILASMPEAFDPAVHVTAHMIAERAGVSNNNALEMLKRSAEEMGLVMVRVRMPTGYVVVAAKRKAPAG